jgi:alpha-amylase
MKRILLIVVLALMGMSSLQSQTTVKKTVLQAFWWDYYNNNYHERWANYLTELAPRLKAMGVDAVWIPPSSKNRSSGYVGYAPFDHYDLGDKFQKGNTRTRLGTKDELLRMIEVMHANGIEVIQDVVLNHVNDAGSAFGNGGVDPAPLSMST